MLCRPINNYINMYIKTANTIIKYQITTAVTAHINRRVVEWDNYCLNPRL